MRLRTVLLNICEAETGRFTYVQSVFNIFLNSLLLKYLTNLLLINMLLFLVD